MQPLTLTQSFHQLDLDDLYHTLSKQQIRELKALLDTTDFRYDIIANLPTELVPLVFLHLDLGQSYQCRRVSRRWHELLSSEQVIKALLHPWTDTEDLPLRVPNGSSPHSILDIQAEHQDAFRKGKPFSSMRIPHGRDLTPGMDSLIHAYSDGLLSWVERSENCDRICLYELETGTLCHFMPPERESIDKIILSGKLLVAMTTSARCYIWTHRTTNQPYSLRLPSRCQIAYHLSDSLFVLLQFQPDLTKPFTYSHSEIIVWKMQDFAVGEPCDVPLHAGVSMIPVRLPSGTSTECWHIITTDNGQQNIVLTEMMVNTDKRIHTLRILHLSISGRIIFEGSLERPYPTDITWSTDMLWGVHESSPRHKQRFLDLWILSQFSQNAPERSFGSSQSTAITHLRYSMDRRVIQLKEQKSISHRHFSPTGEIKELFPWKGIGYFEEQRWAVDNELSYQLRLMDFRTGTCMDAHVGAHRRDDSTVMFFGDEIFLVRVTPSHFAVWCFDKHRPMAGGTILREPTASLCGVEKTEEIA